MAGDVDITLRDYILAILNERNERIEQYLAQMDKAINKAEAATEKRFESVNEFRAQLADQSRTFVPRLEIEGAIGSLEKRVNEIAARDKSHAHAHAHMKGWLK